MNAGRKENYTNVQLYEYNGTLAQQWEIKKIDSQNYNIISKNTNKCLDILWRKYSRWFKYTDI
ncbi:MAG: RICIN domain-containing protein [Clostridia bacterium]|nr:RICIN domain-containing protein [Clostridia bacterium]MBR3255725.1 RICIN domain-containing protein [Clostridia bacterium]